ncbi:MAG: prepilin-type N-terminal cleavage/methylation domain-containing protein [Actinobacteria bacterium]|nr:prepilin-type N-terminal cleavage/methylation domain-containing protein [Actinomycetota bacterium]
MFTKIRNRVESDEGFTLIELLVVILIIGILAAIAIPSFLNQRVKGQDACAKSMARTMQTAMETYYLDTETYASATTTLLNQIENQVPTGGACGSTTAVTVGVAGAGACASAAPGADNYCVGVTSSSTNSFQINRSAAGVISRTCVVPGGNNRGGCMVGNTW